MIILLTSRKLACIKMYLAITRMYETNVRYKEITYYFLIIHRKQYYIYI